VKLMQEDLPPELRLINELLTAEYPQGTLKLLQDKRSDWNAEFVQILGSVAADLEAQKRPETAQRLREIRAQAEAIAKPAGGSILTP
jgi:ubiquinone biosynthesis protein UbiJ